MEGRSLSGMWRRTAIALLVGVAACTPATVQPTTTGTATPTVPTDPPTTQPLVPGCPEGGEFREGGHVGRINQSLSDASKIGAISWKTSKSCETFTISFETSEGAPATTPPTVIVDYFGSAPIIRISLDTVETVITDQLVETALVDRLYVVRSLDNGMFIDLHLAAPTQARVGVETSPAALTIDLQPGIVEYPVGPAISDLAVVVTPLDGETVSRLVDVRGYSRTFEANVLLIATSGGEVVAQENTMSADYLATWGEFRATIELPTGEVSLFVGDQSPKDGTLEGVTFNLTIS